MEEKKVKAIIEAILFASGRQVTIKELMLSLEIEQKEIENLINEMQEEYKAEERGIEIIKVDDSYELCTKKELHENVYPIIDNRAKPKISNASLETLAIIAYNPRITRAEIEAIRGVSADASIYKLLEYNLIKEAGKADLPGKPMTYKTTDEFLKMFGYSSIDELPELPKYKLDSNQQIVIDELEENTEVNTEKVEKLQEDVNTSEDINKKENIN